MSVQFWCGVGVGLGLAGLFASLMALYLSIP